MAAVAVQRERSSSPRTPRPVARRKSAAWSKANAKPSQHTAESASQSSVEPIHDFITEVPSDEANAPATAEAEEQGETSTRPSKVVMRPFELAQTVSELAEKGKLKEAISLVKTSSMGSQNAIVWNTLITHGLRAGQMRISYELFIDMKRRGFKPLPSTWTILFQGFARYATEKARAREPISELNLSRISSAYTQFAKVLQSLDGSPTFQGNDYIISFNAYLDLLLRMKRHRELYEVFQSLPDYPSLKADAVTYSTVLQCILTRPDEAWVGETEQVKEIRDAVLARKVWDFMLADGKARGEAVVVDSHLISAMLRIMKTSPRIPDQQHGLTLIEDYLGLVKPGSLSPPTNKVSIMRGTNGQPLGLSSYSLHLALLLAAHMRRFRHVLHYMQQIQDSQWNTILEVGHMNFVINAHAELAADKGSNDAELAYETVEWMIRQEQLDPRAWARLVPNRETFTLLLRACWKGSNYNLAKKTFALMTGYDHNEFQGTNMPNRPRTVRGRTFLPDAHGMSCLIRSALTGYSQDGRNAYHALRILQHLGLDYFFGSTSVGHSRPRRGADGNGNEQSRRSMRVEAFFRAKLAEAILAALPLVQSQQALTDEFLSDAMHRARAAKMEFEKTWKVGAELKEWSGENLGHDSVTEIESPPPVAKAKGPTPISNDLQRAHEEMKVVEPVPPVPTPVESPPIQYGYPSADTATSSIQRAGGSLQSRDGTSEGPGEVTERRHEGFQGQEGDEPRGSGSSQTNPSEHLQHVAAADEGPPRQYGYPWAGTSTSSSETAGESSRRLQQMATTVEDPPKQYGYRSANASTSSSKTAGESSRRLQHMAKAVEGPPKQYGYISADTHTSASRTAGRSSPSRDGTSEGPREVLERRREGFQTRDDDELRGGWDLREQPEQLSHLAKANEAEGPTRQYGYTRIDPNSSSNEFAGRSSRRRDEPSEGRREYAQKGDGSEPGGVSSAKPKVKQWDRQGREAALHMRDEGLEERNDGPPGPNDLRGLEAGQIWHRQDLHTISWKTEAERKAELELRSRSSTAAV